MNIKFVSPYLAVALALIAAMALPTRVLADDGVPATPQPTQTDDSKATNSTATPEVLPPTLQPSQADTSDAVNASVDTVAAVVDSGSPQATGSAADGLDTSVSVPATATVANAVDALNNVGAVVVDQNQNPVPLSTQATADVLGSSDPYFFNGVAWIGYSSSGVCPVIVTVCNTSSTPFQAAVNAAPTSATIYAESGTYVEQITINKSLVIQGTGSGSTIIQAPAVLNPGTNGERSIVTVTGAGTSVDFSGFTVEGPGPSGCNSINYGIFVRDGAYTNIHDNVVNDIRDAPFGGCQNGVAIGVGRAIYGTSGTATIQNNTITNFQKGGIVVSNSGSSATISGNTIVGAGETTAIAQNGIQVSSGATADVKDNTVSGMNYHIPSGGFPWTAAGVLLYQPGSGTVVDHNTVTNSNVGIYDYQSLNAVISNNSISGSCSEEVGGTACDHGGWGIYSDQSANLEMKNNTLTNNTIGSGFYNSSALIRNNLFSGNNSGFLNDGATIIDATHNCWGSQSGPTNAFNPGGTGDVVGSNILFNPWDCPAAPSAAQKSQGSHSAGSTFFIPVTGGEQVQIDCSAPSMTVPIEDIRVTLSGLCGYAVDLVVVKMNELPAALTNGEVFANGLSITLIKNGQLVAVMPPNASIMVSFPKPANANASILNWNGNAWADLTASTVDGRLVASLVIPNTFVVMTTR